MTAPSPATALAIDQPGRTEHLRSTGLVGVDPIPAVLMMEDHDGAYHAWKQVGVKDRIVVHVDAHMDFDWIPEHDLESLLAVDTVREVETLSSSRVIWNLTGQPTAKLIDLGNYLSPALLEGHLRAIYWVAPDAFFTTPKSRRLVEAMLLAMRRRKPAAVEQMAWSGTTLRAKVCGTPFTICPLAELPTFDEQVLLDIDTDFLVIGRISGAYPYHDVPNPEPWIWPEELIDRLRQRRVRTDCITIAYSVNGGFTPLTYKYLGDDLASLFRNPDLSFDQRRVMAVKREAVTARMAGHSRVAQQRYRLALGFSPDDPSVHFGLAQLESAEGRAEEARQHHQEALRLDPRYRTEYNSFGPVYSKVGQPENAAREYRWFLSLDPSDHAAHRGLAEVLAGKGQWDEAMVHFRRAIELRPDDPRGHTGLGRAYVEKHDWTSAERQFKEASMSPLWAGIAQYWLGSLYAKQHRWAEAMNAYKMARRHRVRNLPLYLALAHLYLRERNWYQAGRCFAKATGLLTAHVRHRLRRWIEVIREMLAMAGA